MGPSSLYINQKIFSLDKTVVGVFQVQSNFFVLVDEGFEFFGISITGDKFTRVLIDGPEGISEDILHDVSCFESFAVDDG